MTTNLLLQSLTKFFLGFIIIGLLILEAVLEQGLEGYGEYKQKVKYRILPFIW